MNNEEASANQHSADHAHVHKKKGRKQFLLGLLAVAGLLSAMIMTNHRNLMHFLPSTALQLFEAPLTEQKEPVEQQEKNESVKKNCTDESCSSKKERKPHKPLNILLLYGDDWRHDSLGVASGGEVKTPFLDSLAEQGMRFTHNCVTTAICWISRATLYMGQYMSRHNSTKIVLPYFYQYWNESFVWSLQTKAGYHVGHVGKWHFRDFGQIRGLWNYTQEYSGNHWYRRRGRGGTGQVHVTTRNEEDALEFLRTRPLDKPFFLGVCFFAPHAVDHKPEQYFPQNYSMQYYLNETMNRSISATNEAWKKMPGFFHENNMGRSRWRTRYETEEKYQHMMKNYYRLITEIDVSSKRIVKELEDQGAIDDTLIIFTTDNGLFHAEHGLAGKWYPHQESIRVPLIIRDPRMADKQHGTTNDDFTLSVDLATTILGAANLPPAPRMQGRDISELYLEDVKDWRTEFFYEHPTHTQIPASTALVRKEWKYMMWPEHDQEQLFHLPSDPLELNDLFGTYNNSSLLAEMRVRHKELKAAAI